MNAQKHMLVYSDSLRWGIVQATRYRHEYHDGWPQIVAAEPGGDTGITTKDLPGCTSVREYLFRNGRKDRSSFLPIIKSHAPVDLIVIITGVNDLQIVYPAGSTSADSSDFTGFE